ncbi:MAG: hypothetical protein WCK37_03485 [Candidatus Falkowbacteria bacterium]
MKTKNANTYDAHTARFIATVATCLPEISSDVMQGWIENPKALKKVLNEALAPVENQKNNLFIFLSAFMVEKALIEATDGKRKIYDSSEIFKGGIDPDFKKFRLNNNNQPTKETFVYEFELTVDAKFVEVFNSLNSDLDKLVMTQAQIICFCEKYPNRLRQGGDGKSTIFLIKKDNEYFVVGVCVDSGGLYVFVRRFIDEVVLFATDLHHVVVPNRIGIKV